MKIKHNFSSLSDIISPSMVFTIGNFDGLHQGHQEIIRTLVSRAGELNAPSCLVTFSEHSKKHLDSINHPHLLLDYADKMHLIDNMGVDIFLEIEFNKKLASLEPGEFLEKLTENREYCSFIVGEDFVFGRGKAGDAAFILDHFDESRRDVIKVPHVILEGSRISSTRLRLLLNEGNITSINKLSARDYFIRGVREAGENIGEKIGFPTINITDIPVMLPANGVYKTRTKYRDLVYSSMSYIGSRPTFGKEKQVVETHLFNFEETVPVGSEVIIYFHEYLRADRKFDSKDELIRQLNLDRQKAMKNN